MDDLGTLPPTWGWMVERVHHEQAGTCLLCERPISVVGIWMTNDQVRLPYGLCAAHVEKDVRQRTAAEVETVLEDRRLAAYEPLPSSPGPAAHLRTVEEHMSLLRFLSDGGAIERATQLYPEYARIFGHSLGGDPEDRTAHGYPGTIPTGRDLLGIMLSHAQPYYWGAALCRAVDDVAVGVPRDWVLTNDMLPTPAAFHWFERPLFPAGDTPAIVAYGWLDCDLGDGSRGLALAKFSSFPARRAGFPSGLLIWPFGRSLGFLLQEMEEGLAADPWGSPTRREATIRFYAASIALLHQRILLPSRHPTPRSTRRRLPVDAPPPLRQGIDVVIFRRALHEDRSAIASQTVEWSCRWIVQGHWRNQWCPGLGRHQPMYILPHIKGPEDKPLKVASGRLFAVIR